MFGLFGARKQEKEMRSALSLHKFESEFPRVLEAFKIVPNRRASKTERYAEIESAARFMLEHAVAQASRAGKLKTHDDLAAAAAFSAILCDYLGSNGGLDDGDVRELQGFVPASVFPKVAGQLMGRGDFKTIVSKGIFKYDSINKKSKHERLMHQIQDAITQFVCQRDLQYLGVLGTTIDELK
jgi:hypothetical protein